jgi:hypothetical protein
MIAGAKDVAGMNAWALDAINANTHAVNKDRRILSIPPPFFTYWKKKKPLYIS